MGNAVGTNKLKFNDVVGSPVGEETRGKMAGEVDSLAMHFMFKIKNEK